MTVSPIKWQKSSFSGGGGENCIHLAEGDHGTILMHESDDPSVVVTTTRENLAAFIAGVKNGEFDHLIAAAAIVDTARVPS
ncbi:MULTISPECIES: DUF397 domain-containing protein [unclassified Streptomyces]|uniref:DUF397 domain-containing protein n=1 Tax=unclassified Streptomyces TaxID=2593676 RepID=UPI0016606A3C|nr:MULTISPECIES: DUF397 domain-containing protein [unclassified Streptomyces]MBD0707297.1 DUF397 domain-containing protein [Streptomyces sp. CBMA291]MBD0713785.1 DUF397 domain-containing protein [Streptomyces sp. CBMA370]